MFAVPKGKGKLEKILKKIFEFSAVPEGKGRIEKFSQRDSIEPSTTAAWASPMLRLPDIKGKKG